MSTARKILPGLLTNRKLGVKQRLQAFIHLTGYLLHPLMVVSFVLACAATLTGLNNPHIVQASSQAPVYGNLFAVRVPSVIALQNLIWVLLGPFIALCTLAPWISSITALRSQHLSVARHLSSFLVLLMLAFGISLSNTREAAKALFTNRTWDFGRTPKYADLKNKQDWKMKKYQVPLEPLWILELAFIFLGAFAMVVAVQNEVIAPLLLLAPFTLGYAFVFVLTVLQSRGV